MVPQFTRERIGFYSGILALCSLLGFLFLAFLLSPTYNLWTQTISKLGTTANGALPFSLAMYLGAILLAIFFVLTIPKYFFDTRLKKAAFLCALLATPCMFLVGLFPSKQPTSDTHDFFAVLLFLFYGLATLLYGISFYNDPKRIARLLSGLGILVALLDIALAISFSFGLGGIVQKIVFLCFNIWSVGLLYYVHQLMTDPEKKLVHSSSSP